VKPSYPSRDLPHIFPSIAHHGEYRVFHTERMLISRLGESYGDQWRLGRRDDGEELRRHRLGSPVGARVNRCRAQFRQSQSTCPPYERSLSVHVDRGKADSNHRSSQSMISYSTVCQASLPMSTLCECLCLVLHIRVAGTKALRS
jgi:hypothetical protein